MGAVATMPGRRSPNRAVPILLVMLLAAVLSPRPAVAQGAPAEPEEDGSAGPVPSAVLTQQQAAAVLASLVERQRVVGDLVQDAVRAYRKLSIERGAVQQELTEGLERIDRDTQRPRELSRERVEQLIQDAERSRQRLNQLLEESAKRLEDLRRLITEREALARRIADVRAAMPQARESLTGQWEVNWLPGGIAGTFFLDQSGTLVTGQYKLGPTQTGSLQGTFINGKLYLQRIDSQRGRDAELEAVVEQDGQRLRGTWEQFELVQGGLPRGQWVARRVR